MDYVQEVTAVKPRAILYVDDRAIEFKTWQNAMEKINEKTS